jgi:hypothetical protein
MSSALFDPAQAGREITHTYVEYVAAHKVVVDHTQQRDAIKGKLIEQLRAAHGHVADFKAFLKEYVQIPRSTAYKLLAIADGRGEEIRQQEREAKQRQRARVHDTEVMDTPEAPALIPDPPTPAEAVELAASQGATMTEPEAAECLRLANMSEAEFEAHVAAETNNIAEVETVAGKEAEHVAAFEFSYDSNERYKEVSKRAAEIGIKLPPPKAGRGWRMIRLYLPIAKAEVIEENLGGIMCRVPVWAARAKDARKPHDISTAVQFIHNAASTIEDVDGWQEMLSDDEYGEPDRFIIDDNIVAGAKAAAEKWAKLYETILRQLRVAS